MKLKQAVTTLCLLIVCSAAFSQKGKNSKSTEKCEAKFGNVTEKDFANKVYAVDSTAEAVVIADIGSSQIEGNNKGWFSLVYKHYKRVHILNKNAFDMANVSIRLFSNGTDEEELDKLKAVTYNLENGKVVETKLDVKESVFKDKLDKNNVIKKFTFPNVKEGSIIEYEYTLKSDFLQNLQPWEFQGKYPRIWSEYNLTLPDFLGYVFLTKGYKKYDISDRSQSSMAFRIIDSRGAGASEWFTFNADVSDYRWVMKGVPALKEENFTTTIDNHTAKIEFQLSEYRQPLTYRRIMSTWPKLTDDLMKSEYFGERITKDNGWLNEITGPLKKSSANKLELAKSIFKYVRDNYTCTERNRLFSNQTFRNLVKTKNGNEAEINLFLTALLVHEGIKASPVILSTRAHGETYELYPLLTQYNYVICQVMIDDKAYYLDASESRMGFNHLPIRCYNGHARVINETAYAVMLMPDSLTETKNTSIFIINDEKGKLVGSMNQTPGYYESAELRDRVKEKGKDQLIKNIQSDFGAEIAVSNFGIDSLDKYDDPINIHYDFDLTGEMEDIIYVNPMFGEGNKENIFKSAERLYPVEMPYTIDESYNLQLEIPKGYVLDEIPKSVVAKMNEEGDAIFEYRVSNSGDIVSLRSRIRFLRSYYLPDEYEMLREFFAMIVKKQAEQIVFKKKK
jgi:hypothetical protein